MPIKSQINSRVPRLIALLFFLLGSLSASAHQPDLSTLMIHKDPSGRYILQIYTALTAFQQEVEYIYSKDSYKTPEEFKDLVIKHFEKNVSITFNEASPCQFSPPLVILGHETKLVTEVLNVPEHIESIYLKNTMFKDMPNNQNEVVLAGNGFPTKQYILNNDNKQTIELVLENDKWVSVKPNRSFFEKHGTFFWVCIYISIPLLVLFEYSKNRPVSS